MPTLGSLVAADVDWHQPGHNKLSGPHTGTEAVFGMVGGTVQDSAGTFTIDDVKYVKYVKDIMGNGSQVAATISFSAQRDSAQMALNGVDVFTVENGQITEAWLYSSDQDAENAFWGNA
jgi:hypothetical protein